MPRIIAFRLALIAQWVLPLAIWYADFAQFVSTPHATAIVLGPTVTTIRLMLAQLAMWLGWLALVAGLITTVGLWSFKRWALYVFAAGALAYTGYVGLCDYFDYTLLPQLALLVQGLWLGGIAAWLRFARQTLPFDAELNSRLTSA